MAEISIKQIVVEIDGELCGVCLPQDRMDILAGFISALSDGPIKVVRLPGLTMMPLSELVDPS